MAIASGAIGVSACVGRQWKSSLREGSAESTSDSSSAVFFIYEEKRLIITVYYKVGGVFIGVPLLVAGWLFRLQLGISTSDSFTGKAAGSSHPFGSAPASGHGTFAVPHGRLSPSFRRSLKKRKSARLILCYEKWSLLTL